MDTLKEFEVRLFDAQNQQILVIPVIAAGEPQATMRAEALCKANGCARFEVRGLMRSARYDRGVVRPSL
jgi:hypothetical protein